MVKMFQIEIAVFGLHQKGNNTDQYRDARQNLLFDIYCLLNLLCSNFNLLKPLQSVLFTLCTVLSYVFECL